MAVLTRAEIIADAKVRGGRKAQSLDSTVLNNAFNAILQKMTEDYPLLRRICHPFTTVAEQSWVALPSDYRSPEQCFYDDDELEWWESDEYFRWLRTQTDTSGTPNKWTVAEDELRLYLWHKPSAATSSYLYYAAVHPKVDKSLAFTSGGTTEIKRGNTATGATGAATMLVKFVRVTSGSWAGGDAAGWIMGTVTGTFQAENLNIGATLNVATISGDATAANDFQHFLGEKFDEVIIEGMTWRCLEMIGERKESLIKKDEFEAALASKAGVKLKTRALSPARFF